MQPHVLYLLTEFKYSMVSAHTLHYHNTMDVYSLWLFSIVESDDRDVDMVTCSCSHIAEKITYPNRN